ncbi:hypothetical protein IWQ60_001961 [Tieghemiomyces parasiticus]|uniref:Uncharacterized protein n=1 Tax=Tieghemiomyces parasiticus TaxID=78921 RepID=A0A9W8AC53_9FUNG|nr:hypothetical protein IWQ60_001961 [Tieghemiomyces parasiticus]
MSSHPRYGVGPAFGFPIPRTSPAPLAVDLTDAYSPSFASAQTYTTIMSASIAERLSGQADRTPPELLLPRPFNPVQDRPDTPTRLLCNGVTLPSSPSSAYFTSHFSPVHLGRQGSSPFLTVLDREAVPYGTPITSPVADVETVATEPAAGPALTTGPDTLSQTTFELPPSTDSSLNPLDFMTSSQREPWLEPQKESAEVAAGSSEPSWFSPPSLRSEFSCASRCSGCRRRSFSRTCRPFGHLRPTANYPVWKLDQLRAEIQLRALATAKITTPGPAPSIASTSVASTPPPKPMPGSPALGGGRTSPGSLAGSTRETNSSTAAAPNDSTGATTHKLWEEVLALRRTNRNQAARIVQLEVQLARTTERFASHRMVNVARQGQALTIMAERTRMLEGLVINYQRSLALNIDLRVEVNKPIKPTPNSGSMTPAFPFPKVTPVRNSK